MRSAIAALLVITAISAVGDEHVDISGHWVGSALQGPGGTRPRFLFEMWLEQSGDDVTGRAKVSIAEQPQYYGIMELQGTVTDGYFSFQEGAILENHPEPGTWWCVKNGELEFILDDSVAELEGKWKAGNCRAPGSIHVRREDSVCGDYRIVSRFDPGDEDYHHYPPQGKEIATRICAAGPRCSRKAIFTLMLSQSRFVAPSADRSPVTSCKVIKVNIGPSSENFVRTTVDEKRFSVTNYTLKDLHLLHPGRVTRSIIERGGSVWVRTEGEGTGFLPSVNEFFAPSVWTGVDKGLLAAYQESTPRKPVRK